ncbi:peptidylprolyl isomerase [Reinekea sp. G2M2-21]|uniref:FKBP-type peptidyl-prolyl cis-trans isomerase n=1 Tax=Reinekea sp. G2M2-21 TaxID=2788942 RepID=UPI0018A91641|nr:peptidylprolyl isomerase [Reinekea sp. G2M2-21]
MNITKDTVVELHYAMSEGETLIESSHEGDSVFMLQGHKNMLGAIEEAIEGKAAGDKIEVTLTPEQAYGVRQENSIQRIPIKHLQGSKKWRPGMVAMVDSNQGRKQVTVVKVGKFNADCDINHPLAGKTLSFVIDIVSVRAANADEISHGHVHGRGGVHH